MGKIQTKDEEKDAQARLAFLLSNVADLKLLQREGLLSDREALANFIATPPNNDTSHVEQAIRRLHEAGLLPGHPAQANYVKDLSTARDASQIPVANAGVVASTTVAVRGEIEAKLLFLDECHPTPK